MEGEQLGNVDIRQAITVGDHEGVTLDVLLDTLHAPTSHRVKASVRQRDPEILLLVSTVIQDLMQAAQIDCDVVVHRLVVEEIFLDHVPAVPETENEVAVP